MSLSIKRTSAWKFNGFASTGANFVISVSGGTINLTSPQGKPTSLSYGGLGAGLSVGFKFPKIGKLKFGANTAPNTFPSKGLVLVTDNCPGDDLTRADMTGGCAFIDAGGGLVAGISGMVLLAGMNQRSGWLGLLTRTALPGLDLIFFLMSARAIIPMTGVNAGVQASVGISGYGGIVW